MALRDFFSSWLSRKNMASSDNSQMGTSVKPEVLPKSTRLSQSLAQRHIEYLVPAQDHGTKEIVESFLGECGIEVTDKVVVPLLQARLLEAMLVAQRICFKLRRWDPRCEIDLVRMSQIILDYLPQLVVAQEQDEIELSLKHLEAEIWRSLVETKNWYAEERISSTSTKLLAA